MVISGHWIRRQIAVFLGILLAVPIRAAATPPQQQAPPVRQPESVSGLQIQSQDPESRPSQTKADITQPEETYPDSPSAANSQATGKTAQSSTPNSGTEQQQTASPQPVGTAVAPYETTTGVAASRPSGAVIAPAKQRRARSILIRVSIVVGGAVAIGTVVALSTASHSRP
jgi:hypothetical protein